MTAVLKHPPESVDEAGQILRGDELLKQQWQFPVFSQQLPVSIRILQLIESDYSPTENRIGNINRTSGRGITCTEEQPGYRSSARTSPADEEGVKTATQEKQATLPLVRLRAYCFGTFELHVGQKKIDKWRSLKAKSLLKFLVACKNRPVYKDVLIEMLWPDCDPEEGKNNLKTVIYSLRNTLLGNKADVGLSHLILYSEGHYLINPEAELWIDVNEFEHHWRIGRKLEKEGKKEEALREFCLAEELYRGDFLEEDRYAEWTLLQREALGDTYLAILSKLATSSFELTDYEGCIHYSQKILLKDVCNEEAYRWLMRCYSRLDNPHRARNWYKVCEKTLKKELDIIPDGKTTNLYQRLLDQESI